MLNDSMNTTTVRLLLPETLWLEPEYFEQARTLSNRFSDERQQWQAYLNGLGRLAFASWLQERLANHHPIHPGSHEFADV